MVQTVRPLQTILNLLADNAVGSISAQDVRDAIVSLYVNAAPLWTDVDHVEGQLVRRPDGRVYEANADIDAGTGFIEGDAGATWVSRIDGSGLITNTTPGNLITTDGSGQPVNSAVREDPVQGTMIDNDLVTSKSSRLGSILSSSTGYGVIFTDMSSGVHYDAPGRPWTEASGSSTLAVQNRAAALTVPFQPRNDATLTGSLLEVNITNLISADLLAFVSEAMPIGSGSFYIEIYRGADATGELYWTSHTPTQIAAGNVFTLDGGNTMHDARPIPEPPSGVTRKSSPLTLLAAEDYFLRFIAVGGDFTVGGTTITQADVDNPASIFTVVGQQAPAFQTVFVSFTLERILTEDDIRTDGQVRTLAANMLLGGEHNGITVERDGDAINLNVTGMNPPVSPDPGVSGLDVGISSSIATGTNLNGTRDIQFTTQATAQIATLSLVVGGGNDVLLTVPATDGNHTQSVTLSGIDTSSEGTSTFQIRGTTSGGQTIMSNTQTVTVRTVQDHERAYYGVQSLESSFTTIPLAQMTGVDVQQPGSSYEISTAIAANNVLGILEPTDRPITSIIEQTFNVESLDRFTRTVAARTISGQTYDLLTLTNNGPTGDIDFEVTHG